MIPPVVVRILGEHTGAIASLKRVNAEMAATRRQNEKDFGEIARMAQRGVLAAAVAGTAIGAALYRGLKVKAGDETFTKGLEDQLKRIGVVYSTVQKDIEARGKRIEKFTRFDAEDSQGALAILVRSTRDYTTANKLLGDSLDLAAAKHIDIAEAATIVAKAYHGQGKALREMGISARDGEKALADLRTVIRGAAEQDGKTLEAQMVRTRRAVDDLFKAMAGAVMGPNPAKPIGDLADAINALSEAIDRKGPAIHGFIEKLIEQGSRLIEQGSRLKGGTIGVINTLYGGAGAAAPGFPNAKGMTAGDMRDYREASSRAASARSEELSKLLFSADRGVAAPKAGPAPMTEEQRAALELAEADRRAGARIAFEYESTRILKAFSDRLKAQLRAREIEGDKMEFVGGRWMTLPEFRSMNAPAGRGARPIQRPYIPPVGRGATTILTQGGPTARGYNPQFEYERGPGGGVRPSLDRDSVEYITERLQLAQDRAKRFTDDLFQAMIHASEGATSLTEAVQNLTRSLAASVGSQLFQAGGSRVVTALTSKQAGRAATAQALQQGLGAAAAASAGSAATGAAAAAGPAGWAMLAGAVGISLLSSVLGDARQREEENYRATLRALRDAQAKTTNITIVLKGTNKIDMSDPANLESLQEGLENLVDMNGLGRINFLTVRG